MARGWTSTVLLLLAASVLMSASATLTDDEVAGMKGNCLNDTEVGTYELDNAGCKDCINLVNLSPSFQVNNRSYACYTICQNDDNAQVPYVFDSVFDGADCQACLLNTGIQTAYGCQACMEVPTANRSACVEHIAKGAPVPAPGHEDEWDINAWYNAAAGCFKFGTTSATDEATMKCLLCISSPTKKLKSEGGILSYEQTLFGNNHTVNQAVFAEPNDFGACVWQAQQAAYLNLGMWEEVEGVYSMCATETPDVFGLTPSMCVDCMVDVMMLPFNGAPEFIHKEYACADYCMEKTQNTTEGRALAAECVACLKSDFPQDPWACSLCMGSTVQSSTECYSCMASDPYKGGASNYNWACSMCWAIEDPTLRNLCLDCIASQDGANDTPFTNFTESNICMCVSMTLNQTIPINRPLEGFELACMMRHTDLYGNPPQDPAIPWGGPDQLSPGVYGVYTTACIECVNTAKQGQGALDKRYACSEYCQDPRIIADEWEGDRCAECVTDVKVIDASVCKMCLEATNKLTGLERDERRAECYDCAMTDRNGLYDNYGWGCSQCAQFSNDDARDACYKCLDYGCTDPCECVQCAKNGTFTIVDGNVYSQCGVNAQSTEPLFCGPPPPPSGGSCSLESIYIWVHTNVGDAPKSLKWRIFKDAGLYGHGMSPLAWYMQESYSNPALFQEAGTQLFTEFTLTCIVGDNCNKVVPSVAYQEGYTVDIWAVRIPIGSVGVQNNTRYWLELWEGVSNNSNPNLNALSIDTSQNGQLWGDAYDEYNSQGDDDVNDIKSYNSWQVSGVQVQPIGSGALGQPSRNGITIELDDSCGNLAFSSLDYDAGFHEWYRYNGTASFTDTTPDSNDKQFKTVQIFRSFKARMSVPHPEYIHPKPSPTPA